VKRDRSVSYHKAVVSLRLAILVSHKAIATFSHSLTLDFEQGLQVSEQSHLVPVVFSVVLNVTLVSTQVANNHLLLSQLKHRVCLRQLELTLALKNS